MKLKNRKIKRKRVMLKYKFITTKREWIETAINRDIAHKKANKKLERDEAIIFCDALNKAARDKDKKER